MAGRRNQITMSEQEVERFVAGQHKVTLATIGKDGQPHMTVLWFVPRDRDIWIYTYGRSQKVRNLEREPRATLMIETGDSYEAMRGVMLVCDAEIVRDPAVVEELGADLFERYASLPGPETGSFRPEMKTAALAAAPKRVAVRFSPTRVVTWDHAKLGGTY